MLDVAVLCMALNIWHEARGEPVIGQYAVAQVTMNRAEHRRDRICRVVYAKHQFSWTLSDVKLRTNPKRVDPHAWSTAKKIAAVVLSGRMRSVDLSRGATHYHAIYVKPKWARVLTKTVRRGKHIFYKL